MARVWCSDHCKVCAFVYDTDECIEWTGSRSPEGYGRYGKEGYTHRTVHKHLIGEIPKGFEVHHCCRNKLCLNPKHLKALSPSDHRLADVGDYCKRGHLLSPDNVWHRKTQPGNGRKSQARICRKCSLMRNRRWYAEHPEARKRPSEATRARLSASEGST